MSSVLAHEVLGESASALAFMRPSVQDCVYSPGVWLLPIPKSCLTTIHAGFSLLFLTLPPKAKSIPLLHFCGAPVLRQGCMEDVPNEAAVPWKPALAVQEL